MRTSQGSTLQSLRAAQAFLDANAEKLGTVNDTGARRSLDDVILKLGSQASIQAGSFLDAQGSTQRQRELRRLLLRDHMAPIARIARAELPNTPEVRPLRMPKGRPTAAQLAAAAQGMAESAAKHAGTFIAAGLPADFVTRLDMAADAMLETLDDRMQSRGQRRGATKGLTILLGRGRAMVGVLDAFVTSQLVNDPALLAQWNVVKRVQLLTGRAASVPAADGAS